MSSLRSTCVRRLANGLAAQCWFRSRTCSWIRLGYLRRIRIAKNEYQPPLAVAFRETDAALATNFGSTVVVFKGWCPGSRVTGVTYSDEKLMVEIRGIVAHSLSWSRDGIRLVAVGEGVAAWQIGEHVCDSVTMSHKLFSDCHHKMHLCHCLH